MPGPCAVCQSAVPTQSRADRQADGSMTLPPDPASGLVCGQVRGGTTPVHERVALPGLRGVLYSRPCSGASGGDIHYLSVCGSGLLSRVCLADVAGHGEMIAAVGNEIHAHLLRSVDVIDERKVLMRLDGRLAASSNFTIDLSTPSSSVPARCIKIGLTGVPSSKQGSCA